MYQFDRKEQMCIRDSPTYDSNTAAMDTIRNSLQALATGASAQEVGDDIVDKMSAYE